MIAALIIALSFWSIDLQDQAKGTLQISIEGIETEQGCIRLAVFNNTKAFQAQEPYAAKALIQNIKGQQHSIKLRDLPLGEYAIAVYHDVNDNGRLDKKKLGIPTEPFAFSNNPKVKWRSPRYKETKFHFSKDQQLIKVRLQEWKAFK